MMGISFQKKPCLSQYQVAKKLDVPGFPLARNNVIDIRDLPRDVPVILTSLTSLNERKKNTNKKYAKKHSQKKLQATISTMFNCCPSNISATVE